MPCSLFLEWLKLKKIHTTVCGATSCPSNLFLTRIWTTWKHLSWRGVSDLILKVRALCIIAGFGHSHPSPLGIQPSPFKTYCPFFPLHFSGHSLQLFRIAALPCAWGGWQAAHQGHGLGRNFLSPPVFYPEIVVKLMAYLSSKFSNKASQLVRTIQPQLVLVWSQGLPQMSLPGPVQKLQSL